MVAEQCTLCSCSLTADNNTEEHIILNAIGGRKKVLGFICQTCNSDAGSEWDDELARQLNSLSIHLGIKRQHGHVPSQAFPTASGKSIRVNADGTMRPTKPEITVTTEEDKISIHVIARSRKELRQALKGLQRKYPKLRDIEVEELILEAQEGSYYSSDLIKISPEFGDIRAGRSLVKSAVALVFDAGIDPTHCDLALDYLLHEGKRTLFRLLLRCRKRYNRQPSIQNPSPLRLRERVCRRLYHFRICRILRSLENGSLSLPIVHRERLHPRLRHRPGRRPRARYLSQFRLILIRRTSCI